MVATSDNAAVNLNLTKILGLQQIFCGNHLLNLDVKDSIKNYVVFNDLVDKISDIMKLVKISIKNTALLSKVTYLKEKLPVSLAGQVSMRWSLSF